MTREEALEKELRKWAVTYRLDGCFHCDLCGGKWGRNHQGRERHTTGCVLRRESDAVAPDPPEVPF